MKTCIHYQKPMQQIFKANKLDRKKVANTFSNFFTQLPQYCKPCWSEKGSITRFMGFFSVVGPWLLGKYIVNTVLNLQRFIIKKTQQYQWHPGVKSVVESVKSVQHFPQISIVFKTNAMPNHILYIFIRIIIIKVTW